MTSPDLDNAIFLQELVDGARRSPLRESHRTTLYGQVAAPANPSVWPAKEPVPTTHDTSGPSFDVLLRTAILQSSLGNKLRQRMAATGSLEYDLTWKSWDMVSGLRICALRASARRISDSDCGGWQTVTVQDGKGRDRHNQRKGGVILSLLGEARIAGYPTPCATDYKGPNPLTRPICDDDLPTRVARMTTAGWGTPSVRDWKDAGPAFESNPGMVTVASRLPRQVMFAGVTTGYPAETGKRGVLNPEFCRWLMGYPEGWGLSADTATP